MRIAAISCMYIAITAILTLIVALFCMLPPATMTYVVALQEAVPYTISVMLIIGLLHFAASVLDKEN